MSVHQQKNGGFNVDVTSGCTNAANQGVPLLDRCHNGQRSKSHEKRATCLEAVIEKPCAKEAYLNLSTAGANQDLRYLCMIPGQGICNCKTCDAEFLSRQELPAADSKVDQLSLEDAIHQLNLPYLGDGKAGHAKLSVVTCGALSSSFAPRVRERMEQLSDAYPQIDFYYASYSMAESGSKAKLMAFAGIAAHKQGKFLSVFEGLSDSHNRFDGKDLIELAKQAGLDADRFAADLNEPSNAQLLANQRAWCEGQGAQSEPSFLIGDEWVEGIQSFEEFSSYIDQALDQRRDN